jgi:hypothetical protein
LADVAVHRWLVFPGGPVELRTVVEGSRVTLLAGNEPVAAGRVLVGEVVAKAPEVMPALVDARTVEDPYASGALFHGPAFQMLRSLRIGSGGASAEVDCAERGVPRGALHQGLLDALTHAIPHDELWRWSSEIDAGVVGYPCRIPSMKLYGEMPTDGVGARRGAVRGVRRRAAVPEVRDPADRRRRVRVALTLVEVLLPKGAIGRADRLQRRAFLRDRREFVAGLGLARAEADATVVTRAEVAASDWLPGNVARIYGVTGTDVLAEVAVRDHVAQRAKVHPQRGECGGGSAERDDGGAAAAAAFLDGETRRGDSVRVAEERPPARDLGPIEGFWREWLGVGAWPIEDLFLGLVDRFVGDVVLADPDGFNEQGARAQLPVPGESPGRDRVAAVLGDRVGAVGRAGGHAGEARAPAVVDRAAHRAQLRLSGGHGSGAHRVLRTRRSDVAQADPRRVRGRDGARERGVVHVEGTRSLTCRRPVASMSSVFLDMALTVGAPIVPVRFVGGLPVEPLEMRGSSFRSGSGARSSGSAGRSSRRSCGRGR